MPTIHVEGEQPFEAPHRKRLVLAIEDAGIDILHRCGGYGRCTTCRVEIRSGEAGPRTLHEIERLAGETFPAETRLSCQVLVQADLSLHVPLRLSSSGLTNAGPRPKDEITPPPRYPNEDEAGSVSCETLQRFYTVRLW
jgi:ferredoxin